MGDGIGARAHAEACGLFFELLARGLSASVVADMFDRHVGFLSSVADFCGTPCGVHGGRLVANPTCVGHVEGKDANGERCDRVVCKDCGSDEEPHKCSTLGSGARVGGSYSGLDCGTGGVSGARDASGGCSVGGGALGCGHCSEPERVGSVKDKLSPGPPVGGDGGCGVDASVQSPLSEKSGCIPNSYGHVRGPNWKYNNANRIRRKAQRATRAMLSDNWRKSEAQGFFSECDGDVQKDLRDSRAKLYIAQNRVKAEKAERELRDMNSVQGVIQQMTDVSAAVAKLQKQTTDDAVHGWAKTVASSLTKSITESSSNVPSLESIKIGESSLKSSDGRVLDPARVGAYERDLKYVEDVYADMDGYSVEVYERDIKRVKDSYDDVLLTPEERAVKQFKKETAARMFSNGLSYDKISDCLLIE